MNTFDVRLSQRYAQAVMHVSGKQITPEMFERISNAQIYLTEHKKALTVLRGKKITKEDAQTFATLIFGQFDLVDFMMPLVQLLVASKRMHLIPAILVHMITLYQEQHNSAFFRITSAPMLDYQQLQTVVDFLAHETGKKITYSATEDARLVAGIRAQSAAHKWEYSISSQLRRCRKAY